MLLTVCSIWGVGVGWCGGGGGGCFFQAEDGIRYLVRSRGLGDVYKRQGTHESLRNRRFAREERRGNLFRTQSADDAQGESLSLIHI